MREVITVFSDVSIKDLTFLFRTNNKPILVLENNRQILGLIESKHFNKGIALEKSFTNILSLLNTSYKVLDNLYSVNENVLGNYQYIILKENQEYHLYHNWEIEL